jgi:hypothetical protein
LIRWVEDGFSFRDTAFHRRAKAAIGVTVPILGETGVGKELVAPRLHARSARHARPLVQINCAALPETLADSELFSHERVPSPELWLTASASSSWQTGARYSSMKWESRRWPSRPSCCASCGTVSCSAQVVTGCGA